MGCNETPTNVFQEKIMQSKITTLASKINPVAAVKNRRYEKMIAESQAKIGPYVPTTCPTQIWA